MVPVTYHAAKDSKKARRFHATRLLVIANCSLAFALCYGGSLT
jgi:hypothetical protein